MYQRWISACLLALATSHGHAVMLGDWQLSGYLSQGASYTSDNNAFGESDDRISFDFSEGGLLLQGELLPRLQFSGKLAYRAPYSLQSNAVQFDHLLLDVDLFSNQNSQLGARLGRVKLHVGLYNTTRDTSYSWPTATMSEAVYPYKQLPLYLSLDGINVYYHHNFSSWSLKSEASIGNRDAPASLVEDFFLYDVVSSDDLVLEKLKNFNLELEHFSSGLRLAYNLFSVKDDVSFSIESIGEGGAPMEFQMQTFSLSKNWTQWQLDLEFTRFDTQVYGSNAHLSFDITNCDNNCALLQSLIPTNGLILGQDVKLSPRESHVATLHRLFPSGLDLYFTYGRAVESTDDPKGTDFQNLTALPAHLRYTYHYGVGMIMPLNEYWDLAAEAQYFEGTGSLLFADTPVNGRDLTKHWHQAFVRLTYHF